MISEQEKNDIILLYNQGECVKRIAERLATSAYYVKKTITEKGIKIRKSTTKIHTTSKKKQILELWKSGLQDINIIADKLNTKKSYVNTTLNREGISTTAERIKSIDDEINIYLDKKNKGEKVRGYQSKLAKKYKCTRQYINLRAKEMIKNTRLD